MNVRAYGVKVGPRVPPTYYFDQISYGLVDGLNHGVDIWKDLWIISGNPERSCKSVVHFLEMCGISEMKITPVSM